jgi:hypothetical protein
VGLVQATLAGKTRLIIEASLRHLIILIPFKRNNKAYKTLKRSLQEHDVYCETFQERQHHNRLILLKVRLFLLAFLDFAVLYKTQILGNTEWAKVDDTKKLIFSAFLLNGGGELVDKIFQSRLDQLNLQTNPDLENIKKSIVEELKYSLEELESPWIAFDECHVPESSCVGLLFHSNYHTLLDEKKATVSIVIL